VFFNATISLSPTLGEESEVRSFKVVETDGDSAATGKGRKKRI
jgi:hypothetical protein